MIKKHEGTGSGDKNDILYSQSEISIGEFAKINRYSNKPSEDLNDRDTRITVNDPLLNAVASIDCFQPDLQRSLKSMIVAGKTQKPSVRLLRTSELAAVLAGHQGSIIN